MSATSRTDTSSTPYQDGVYEARGWYGSLPSHIDVTVTLTRGRLTHVHVTPRATDPTSLSYQRRFANAVSRTVTGRRIDELQVTKLAGASGTPDGFNDALAKIKREAQR